jgi:glycosyltransferase involved in cell wall biosynthesis
MVQEVKQHPLVSVIIPTFNRWAMLQEAIHSVEQQSYLAWELIVVDDGSTDETRHWQPPQKNITILHYPLRRGPSVARNAGSAYARGEYLAFLDSDDLFLPHKLEQQVLLFQSEPTIALCHTNEIWIRHGQQLKQQKKHEKRGGFIFEHCLPMCRISPSASMIQRSVFEALGGFDEELEVAEDYEFWLRLTCRYSIGFISEPLIIKRGGHSDQLSQKYGQIEKFRIEALRRILRRAPLTEEQRRAATTMLKEKCVIYALGCEKRGRQEEALYYRKLGEERDNQETSAFG